MPVWATAVPAAVTTAVPASVTTSATGRRKGRSGSALIFTIRVGGRTEAGGSASAKYAGGGRREQRPAGDASCPGTLDGAG